ncbi:MAG TPA: tetratricopeptide repeat protein, partial [Thermoanaerobaculia bacterium]
PQVMQYPASVAVTWQKTFHQLGPTAGALLRLTAFLAPDPIPVVMFEAGEEIVREAAKLLARETRRKSDTKLIKAALADLATYSMIARQEGGTFAVHRMVQEVLRQQIPEKRRRDWIELSLRIVNRFSPSEPYDVRTWPVWNVIRPHAAQVVKHADEAGITDPTSRLVGDLGILLYFKSLHAEAEPLMRRSLAIVEDSFGAEHPRIAVYVNNLAQLLQATNRRAEAEPLMRRALAIDEAAFGTEHPNVAIRLNNLAALLQATNRLAEAEPLMRRALAIDEASFGAEHPKVAIRLNNLAQLLQATNRRAEAEPLMRRAVEIFKKSLGPDHPYSQGARRNLAALLQPPQGAPGGGGSA